MFVKIKTEMNEYLLNINNIVTVGKIKADQLDKKDERYLYFVQMITQYKVGISEQNYNEILKTLRNYNFIN